VGFKKRKGLRGETKEEEEEEEEGKASTRFFFGAGLLLLCGWRKRRKRRDSSSSSDSTFQTQESHIAIVQGFNVCEEENFRVNSLVHFGLPP
jgi:hypothetical protein